MTSSDDAIALQPLTALSKALDKRTISSRELLEEYLRRLEVINPAVNAVVTLDVERAFESASRCDEARARGVRLGPLHGLPFTVKDAIESSGIRSTGGARELAHYIPAADAPAVARLRKAGGVLFGKSNTPKWCADIQTYNELFGTTNNPWDTDRTSGGSSGGSAVAVSTGLTAFELGTDIGGSVRIPANFCGVFGHKPTFGLIPQRGYLDRVGGSPIDVDVNVFGPIARAGADLEVLLEVLAGPSGQDAKAWRVALPAPRHRRLNEYRIGLWLDDSTCEVDAEVGDVLAAAVDAIAGAGGKLVDARPPLDLAQVRTLFFSLLAGASSNEPEHPIAPMYSRKDWLRLHEERTWMQHVWAEWFRDFDVLLCPVTPMAAFVHDHDQTIRERTVTINGRARPHLDASVWTGLVGAVYLPATVVPVGFTKETGLPVGVQVVGPYLEDRSSIFVAEQIASLTGGYTAPPLSRLA